VIAIINQVYWDVNMLCYSWNIYSHMKTNLMTWV